MADDASYQLAHIKESRVPSLITSGVICLSAAYVAVTLRCISRRLAHARFGADDWCMVLGLIFTSVFTIDIFVLIHFGLGRHAVLIGNPTKFAKLVVATEIIYNPAVVAIKSSILLLYRRLFPGRRFHIILWCIGGFVLSYSSAQSLVEVFECSPINSLWNLQVKGKCINLSAELIASSVFNVVTDILLLVLPLPILWRLQISMERKLELIGIFLLGGFVCIVSIIRTPQVRTVSLTDPSWSDVNGVVWSIVELNIGIVSACLPTLRPVFTCMFQGHRQLVPKLKNSATSYESPDIRLRGFNKSSTGEGYGQLRTSADLQGLVHSDRSRDYESDWEVQSLQKACDRSKSSRASNPGLIGTLEEPDSLPHAIRVTTELEVRNIAGKDVTQS